MNRKADYQKQILNPLKVRLFFLTKLPSLFFWGVKVTELSGHTCRATIPYGWKTRNPFKSMYFAAQAGAAEISTGALVQASFQGRGRWAMYVTGFRAEYGVVAKSKITFTCTDGDLLADLISNIESTGEPQEIEMIATGANVEGKMVSRFYITWSLKKK